MQKVISALIIEVTNLRSQVNNLDFVLGLYHEWKKEKEKFGKFLREKVEKLTKDRDSSSSPSK